MEDQDRVVTTKLPGRLAAGLDEEAARTDRSRSWIMREALHQWLADARRRVELEREDLHERRVELEREDLHDWPATSETEAKGFA